MRVLMCAAAASVWASRTNTLEKKKNKTHEISPNRGAQYSTWKCSNTVITVDFYHPPPPHRTWFSQRRKRERGGGVEGERANRGGMGGWGGRKCAEFALFSPHSSCRPGLEPATMRPLDALMHLWLSVCSLLILTSCEEQRIPEGESASRSSIADARLFGGSFRCLNGSLKVGIPTGAKRSRSGASIHGQRPC